MKKIFEIIASINKVKICFLESATLKDKWILFKYCLITPFFLLQYLLGKKMNNKLSSPIFIKNKLGIFHTGDKIYYAFAFTTKSDLEIRKEMKIEKGVFIDVGANGGMHTIPIALSLGSKGKVIAIEPEPKNFSILEKNVKLNHLDNVICIKSACFKEEKKVKLFLDKEGQGGHSLIEKTPVEKKGFIEINTRKLDNIITENKIERVDMIKLDVEGAELDVLIGAMKILKKYKPKIIFESWNEKFLNKTEIFLNPFGYKIRRIDKSNYLAY